MRKKNSSNNKQNYLRQRALHAHGFVSPNENDIL